MWGEFVDRMMDWKENCDNTPKGTRAMLQTMNGIDVEGTLDFFRRLGGYCDCEVWLNVILKYESSIKTLTNDTDYHIDDNHK